MVVFIEGTVLSYFKMTQMSDKFLLSKTEEKKTSRYLILDKLRLSESAEASVQGTRITESLQYIS